MDSYTHYSLLYDINLELYTIFIPINARTYSEFINKILHQLFCGQKHNVGRYNIIVFSCSAQYYVQKVYNMTMVLRDFIIDIRHCALSMEINLRFELWTNASFYNTRYDVKNFTGKAITKLFTLQWLRLQNKIAQLFLVCINNTSYFYCVFTNENQWLKITTYHNMNHIICMV